MTLHADFQSATGFSNPVQSSQAVFRCVMNALARPGSIQKVTDALACPRPLTRATAAVVLALFDHDTPIWLDEPLIGTPDIASWLRFQTAAPLTQDATHATFALIHNVAALPDFESFAQGTLEYPDRSATLIIQVETLMGSEELTLSGPGIRGTATLCAGGLPLDFVSRMAANRALFPRGVDLLLVCGDELVALPRSTHVATKEM